MAKILIVDDSRTVVAVFSKLLGDRGHQCISAPDGALGFARAKEQRPDLILMDVVMGEHNGFQTCRRLKRDLETRDIPVVLVSSKDTPADEFWGKRMGAAEYLPKPVAPERLLDTVSRLLPVDDFSSRADAAPRENPVRAFRETLRDPRVLPRFGSRVRPR